METVLSGAIFFFQAEDCIRDKLVTGVQTCALPISILDHHMPEMDGIMLARAIRSQPELNQLELILLSSHGDLAGAEGPRSAGFAACLAKPARLGQLRDCLTKVLQHS